MHLQRLITGEERDLLEKKEAIIRKGKKAFIEVGLALAEIRNKTLFRQEFKTFTEYCECKWGIKKAYANQLIQSADAVGKLPKEAATMVFNQRQGRAIAGVPEPDRVKVLEAASQQAESEGREMTARDITNAASEQDPPVDIESTVMESQPATPTDTSPAPAKTQSGEHVWTIEKFETAIETIRSEFMDEYADREDFLRIGSIFMRAQVAKLEKRITHLRRKKQTPKEGQI